MSVKKSGAKAILYKVAQGAAVTSGVLSAGATWLTGWYKIGAFKSTGSALPALKVTSIFKTPGSIADQITLATGDIVYPLTLTEVCKVDLEISAEKGSIDATDSCDYPYTVNLPDGFSNLSGSINTMLRFDEDTNELLDSSTEFLGKFFDVVEDDGEGTYVLASANDDDILLMILLNSEDKDVDGMVENWIITPAMLSSASTNVAMKDVLKGDFSWSKGQGQASIYKRTVPVVS
jgi:hypothetical protein